MALNSSSYIARTDMHNPIFPGMFVVKMYMLLKKYVTICLDKIL